MRDDNGNVGRWPMWAQEVMDGYTDSSHVPGTQGTGTPAPETQRAGKATAPRGRGLYRYLLLFMRLVRMDASESKTEGTDYSNCSVDFARDSLWGLGRWWGNVGGEGITGGSMSVRISPMKTSVCGYRVRSGLEGRRKTRTPRWAMMGLSWVNVIRVGIRLCIGLVGSVLEVSRG